MSYRLIAEHHDHYKVQHPDGGIISVAKKGLGAETKKKIEAMGLKPMADGGEIDADDAASDTAGPPANDIEPVADAATPAAGQAPLSIEAIPQATPAGAPQVGPSPASIPGQAPTPGLPDPNQIPGYAGQAAGIKDLANAEGAKSDAMAKAYQAQLDAQQKQADLYQGHLKQLDDEHVKLQQDIASNKIDPNNVWNKMDTGNKILAGVSILLGGFNGQPNGAVAAINKNIDRDIEAQKAELGKKENLLNDNLKKYGTLNAAEAATRLQLLATTQAQIGIAAAKSGSAEAQARAKLGIGMLQQQYQLPLMQQLAKYRTDQQLYGNGGTGEGGLPVGAEGQYMSDPKYRENRVVVGDKAYQAAGKTEAEDLRKSEALYDPIQKDAKFLQSMGNGVIDPADRDRVRAAQMRLAMNLNEFNGYKRFSDTDKDAILKQFNDPNALTQLASGTGATADTLKAVRGKLESERANKLVGYKTAAQQLPSASKGWN